MKKKLVLASQSPRRRELMTYFNMPFDVISPSIEEIFDTSLPIDKQIEKIARDKAMSVIEAKKESIVIGADTVVVCDGKVLGKPKTPENAIEMLTLLSGKKHQVITGVAIVSSEKEFCFNSKTEVEFYELSEEEIKRYVDSKEPLDKAGAYTIQGWGSLFVKNIKGDFYTVVGLPIARIYHELLKRDW